MAAKPETILRYSHELYEAMLARSTTELPAMLLPAESDRAVERVFIGQITHLYNELRLSPVCYPQIRKLLVSSGAIEMVQKGNKHKPSVIALYHSPPDAVPEDFTMEHLTTREDVAKLHSRVETLEGWRESQKGIDVATALRNLENRIAKLEREAKTSAKEPQATSTATTK